MKNRIYFKEELREAVKVDKNNHVTVYIWSSENKYIFDYMIRDINVVEINSVGDYMMIDFLNITKSKTNRVNTVMKKIEYIQVEDNSIYIKLK